MNKKYVNELIATDNQLREASKQDLNYNPSHQYLYCAHYIANTVSKTPIAAQTKTSFRVVFGPPECFEVGDWERKRKSDRAYFDTFDEAANALVEYHYNKAEKAIAKAIRHINDARAAAEDYEVELPADLYYLTKFKM